MDKKKSKKELGVLVDWYIVKRDLSLEKFNPIVRGYCAIEQNYASLRSPIRNNDKIFVSQNIYNKIKKFMYC